MYLSVSLIKKTQYDKPFLFCYNNNRQQMDLSVSTRSDVSNRRSDLASSTKSAELKSPALSQRVTTNLEGDSDLQLHATHKQTGQLEKLYLLRKQIKILKMYTDQIKIASFVEKYNRKTYLGQPKLSSFDGILTDDIYVDDEEDSSMRLNDIEVGNKLSPEENLDDFYIRSQFVAGAASEFLQESLKMDVEADILRLAQMYIESVNKLKVSMPSKNVEDRFFTKQVQLYRITTSKNNPMDQLNKFSKGSSQSIKLNDRGSVSQSMSGTSQINVRSSALGSQIEDQPLFQGSTADLSRLGSVSANNSMSMMLGGMENAKKEDFMDVESQTTPKVYRASELRMSEKDQWQALITELHQNHVLMADVVSRLMQDGKQFTLGHQTMLVNLGQFFWESMHTEERLAFKETNHFLKFFAEFATKEIVPEKFGKNSLKNTYIKDKVLEKTLMCIFEGLTRKMTALNYLRFIFAGPFDKISLYQIEEDLNRLALRTAEQLRQQAAAKSTADEESKQQPTVTKKKTFFGKIWDKITGDDDPVAKAAKEKKLSDQKLTVQSQLVSQFLTQKKTNDDDEDELDFDSNLAQQKDRYSKQNSILSRVAFATKDPITGRSVNQSSSQSESAPTNSSRLFESMARVYGGSAEPFKQVVNKNDDAALLRRFEEVEQKLRESQVNTQRFVMDDYPSFEALPAHRIEMTQQVVKELCSGKHRNAKKIEDEIIGTGKPTKDLTYYIKTLIQKNFEQILNFSQKVPFSIRAMLKILILRSRGISDFTYKLKLDADEIQMLSRILVGGWLNIGYRNPICFGIQPPAERELELQYIFFEAARITFEHTMMMQTIPEDEFVKGFDIIELNRFIRTMSSHVFIFWIRLLNVDISEIPKKLAPSLIDSHLFRIDDLELLYLYCKQVNDPKRHPKLSQILTELQPQQDDYDTGFDKLVSKPLTQRNIFNTTLTRHWWELLMISERGTVDHEHEYYILFLNKRSAQQIEREHVQWQQQCADELRQVHSKFIVESLALQIHEPAEQVTEAPPVMIKKSILPPHLQKVPKAQPSQPLDQRQLMVSQRDGRLIPMHLLEQTLSNMSASLSILLEKPQLLLEQLRDQKAEQLDLVQLLQKAAKFNQQEDQADIQLQVGCQHLCSQIQKLGLADDFVQQDKILDHFLRQIDLKVKQAKRFLDSSLFQIEVLAADAELFEWNITYLKQFHMKYENNLKFMKTISRYNPEVCFLECFKFQLNDDWKNFRGLLLNLSCSLHQTNLPMSSYMLFGVVSLKAAGMLATAQQGEMELIGQEELTIRKVREKRINRFRLHHCDLIGFTVKLQNSQEGVRPWDLNIRLIETMIQQFTQKNKTHLKTLCKADDEKYEALLDLDVVNWPAHWTDLTKVTKKEKFQYLQQQEPLDYMNIVKTYTMFLQHLSVLSSTATKDYVYGTDDLIKQHYDFLHCDLPAKALRYQVHEYIMKRMHRTIFGTNRNTEMDELVQKLIMAKANHPLWVLTSPESRKKYELTGECDDFTKQPEWCDPFIYSASLKTLLRISDEETPHMKAIYIDDAVTQAIDAILISTPYKKSDAFGEPDRMRVMRHLLLEYCKIYDRANTNPRLYSQLLFVLHFNVPQNEIVYESLIKKQLQDAWYEGERDYSKLPLATQHEMMLAQLSTRYKVAEWFNILRQLIIESQQQQ